VGRGMGEWSHSAVRLQNEDMVLNQFKNILAEEGHVVA
jgi:hypothetical protein